jgi:AraC family transcriptional regulator of adaptative response/methylated-DNA-[protein]-cysteine methyltransferase
MPQPRLEPDDPSDDDRRWQAVAARDAASDGLFRYAVTTTGVYCRPSCPSRRPRRDNVRFFSSPAAAEAAGFRACKRCRPAGSTAAAPPDLLVAAACRAIEDAEAPPSLATLARDAGLSPFHFHRRFKAALGVTPKAYAAAVRRRRLRAALDRRGSVTAAILDAGYGASSRFYAEADAALGMTPRSFRSGGAGAEIRFATGRSSLGTVLVAETRQGIAAILLGHAPQPLLDDLRRRFPKATLVAGDTGFAHRVASIVALVEDPRRGLDLPLDIRGTAFQQRVWEALRRIPAGTTATYADIARAIGRPKAVRAVAAACAANPLAVAVPCHRVVRGDGALAGYRWGIARKRALIAREAASTPPSRRRQKSEP